MSLVGDYMCSLKYHLEKYKDRPEIVIDVFYDLVTNQSLDKETIVNILKTGLGINTEIDVLLQEHIDDTIKTYN